MASCRRGYAARHTLSLGPSKEMIKPISLVLASALLSILKGTSFADCAACTVSKGITIKLKSGKVEKGYTTWNDFMPEQLPDAFGFRKDPRAHALIERQRTIKPDQAFDYWLDLLNFVAQHNLKALPNWPAQNIPVYYRLAKVPNPSEHYVGIREESVEVPVSAIAEILKNPELLLNVDTTGMDILSGADIEQLLNKPRFTVQVEGSMGGTSYVVYGDKVTLAAVLEHAAASARGDFGDVLVNGVRIRGGHSGAGPAIPLDQAPQLGPLKDECQGFLAKLGEADQTSCEAERSAIQEQLHVLPLGDPKRAALGERQRELKSGCVPAGGRTQPKWKSLGNKDELRTLGIVVSNYSWD
jgi:hypothetical protein